MTRRSASLKCALALASGWHRHNEPKATMLKGLVYVHPDATFAGIPIP